MKLTVVIKCVVPNFILNFCFLTHSKASWKSGQFGIRYNPYICHVLSVHKKLVVRPQIRHLSCQVTTENLLRTSNNLPTN